MESFDSLFGSDEIGSRWSFDECTAGCDDPSDSVVDDGALLDNSSDEKYGRLQL